MDSIFSLATIGTAVALLLTTCCILLRGRTPKPNANLPPMIPASPWLPRIISHTYYVLLNWTVPQSRAIAAQHGPVTRAQTILGERVIMTGPEAAQWVFEHDNTHDNTTLCASPPRTLASLLGRYSVVVVSGDRHRKLRDALKPMSTHAAVKHAMLPLELLVTKFLSDISERSCERAISVHTPVKQLVFDALLTVTVGADTSSDPRLHAMMVDFADWDAGNFTLFPHLPGSVFRQAMHARTRIRSALAQCVVERKEQQALLELVTCAKREPRVDVLQFLLDATRGQDGAPFSNDEMLDSLLAVIFCGYATSTSVICSALYALKRSAASDTVASLREEAMTVFPSGANALMGYDAIVELPYLEAFVREVLRMFLPLPMVGRRLMEDAQFVCPAGMGAGAPPGAAPPPPSGPVTYDLPIGTDVFLDIMSTMHDERYYANPDCFDPARFLPGREEDKAAPGTFVPFGAGARQCLGQPLVKLLLKLVLLHLVRNYDVGVDSFVEQKFPLQAFLPSVRLQRREAVDAVAGN